MQRNTGMVIASGFLGGVLGCLWINLLARDVSWFEYVRGDSAPPFVLIASLFCTAWSAITIGMLAYALIIPNVGKKVAMWSAMFLACLILGTSGPMTMKTGSPSFLHWLTTVYELTAPASLGAILTIATVLVKLRAVKRSQILVQS